MQLKGNISLITGGASGLGWGVASSFLAAGAKVGILDLDRGENRSKVETLGSNALFCPCDVTEKETVATSIQEITKKLGPLSIAVNCAGIGAAFKIVSHGKAAHLELYEKILQVNLLGTINVSRLAAEAMSQNQANDKGEKGVIINTASIAAFDGQMGQTAYAASKGGIVGLTLPMARDLAGQGIRVMTIAPGLFDTPLLAALPDAARESLAKQIPFPSRFGKPEEYAALVQHIVENVMLNGEVIRLDGALRMGMK